MNLGPRIVALREERRISLSELSRESNISKSLLHRIENNEGANPELETLRKIAKALKITVGELIGNEVVQNARQLPENRPEWLTKLTARLKQDGKEPDKDFLEALYVLQNRKGQAKAAEEDWLYIYQTFERSFNR
ncbi:MAG: helix-turn-helix transcriptional regulator [Luteolibacter sp.]|uniref:helix-turn-helix domain-containing protein n=1 Tax=Luteolibacter sp. TaxID=1962973 RepID=UPI003263CE1F